MNRQFGKIGCKSHELFRLRFQQLLSEYASRRCSVAEGFGPAWERAIEEISLPDHEQGPVYQELIAWAKVIHSGASRFGKPSTQSRA
jgi:hypothetical protein